MEDTSRPILILFMGERTEHAELSIENFYPASVHIITSDKFGPKYEEILSEWSSKYDFRPGKVTAIDNLFTTSAIQSLLFAAFNSLKEETDKTGDVAYQRPVFIGITGGTMHMAAAGTYLGQLIDATPFYVVKPPEGKAPVARRDIIAFPTLDGISFISRMNAEHLDYIMTKSKGSLQEFYNDTGLPEEFIVMAGNLGMLGANPDEDEWWITPIGYYSFGFITQTRVWNQYGHLLRKFGDSNDNSEDYDPSVM